MKALITSKGNTIKPINLIDDGSEIKPLYKTLMKDNVISFILNKFKENTKEAVFNCSGSELLSLLPLETFTGLISGLDKDVDVVIKNKETVSAITLINVLSYIADYRGLIYFKGGNDMLPFIETKKYKKETVIVEIREKIDLSKIMI